MSYSPLQVVILAYDGIIRFINAAHDACNETDPSEQSENVQQNVTKAQLLIAKLQSNLNMDEGGEAARQLKAVYEFATEQLKDIATTKDRKALAQVQSMFVEIRDAWSEVAETFSQPYPQLANI
jgi:flagellar secretion chaperone FliS